MLNGRTCLVWLPLGEGGYVQFSTDPVHATAHPQLDVDPMVTRPIRFCA